MSSSARPPSCCNLVEITHPIDSESFSCSLKCLLLSYILFMHRVGEDAGMRARQGVEQRSAIGKG
jgi:hypothetical protein